MGSFPERRPSRAEDEGGVHPLLYTAAVHEYSQPVSRGQRRPSPGEQASAETSYSRDAPAGGKYERKLNTEEGCASL